MRRRARRPGAPSWVSGACLVASGQAAATAPLDAQQRVSQMGPDGDLSFVAGRPSVAYNPRADQYLVRGVVRERRRRGARDLGPTARRPRHPARRPAPRSPAMGPDGDPGFRGRQPSPSPTTPRRTSTWWRGRAGTWDTTPGAEEVFVPAPLRDGRRGRGRRRAISVDRPRGQLRLRRPGPRRRHGERRLGRYLVVRGVVAEARTRSSPSASIRRRARSAPTTCASRTWAPRATRASTPARPRSLTTGAPASTSSRGTAPRRPSATSRSTSSASTPAATAIGANDQRISETRGAFASGRRPRRWPPASARATTSSPGTATTLRPCATSASDDDLRPAARPRGRRGRRGGPAHLGHGPRRRPGRVVERRVASPTTSGSDEYLVAWMGRRPARVGAAKGRGVRTAPRRHRGRDRRQRHARVGHGRRRRPRLQRARPSVAYGSQANEYMLVWEGGDLNAPDVATSRRSSAATGLGDAPPAPRRGLQDPAAAAGAARQGRRRPSRSRSAQLRINQRISQAAIRRAQRRARRASTPACEARDLCGYSVGPTQLGRGITSAPAAASLAPAAPADPAAIVDPGRRRPGRPADAQRRASC